MTLFKMSLASKSFSSVAKESFSDVVRAIAEDMPLVMHGSGDAPPSAVNDASVQLLSELTATYIGNLVETAIDAHIMLNDGPQPLPPPPLPQSRKVPVPAPPVTPVTVTEENDLKKATRKRRRRATDEFWDEPLAEPKIKNKPTPKKVAKGPQFEGVPVDEWVGVAGVDFWETSRARKAHVGIASAISTQCFIFPVCHDVGLYGKVLDVQGARRSIAPILVDPVIQELMISEASAQGPGSLRKRKKKRNNEEDVVEEPEDTDSEGEDGAAWPGLESLLPVHTTADLWGSGT